MAIFVLEVNGAVDPRSVGSPRKKAQCTYTNQCGGPGANGDSCCWSYTRNAEYECSAGQVSIHLSSLDPQQPIWDLEYCRVSCYLLVIESHGIGICRISIVYVSRDFRLTLKSGRLVVETVVALGVRNVITAPAWISVFIHGRHSHEDSQNQ